ncbi:MAG: N-formylglutamate amidohydrolase [Candidatus Binatia bacterium]
MPVEEGHGLAMSAVTVLNPKGQAPLVLTCEHASHFVPTEYDGLGLDAEQLVDHIGWDIGARDIIQALVSRIDAAAILAGVSRLVVDCNRDLADDDLIVRESHGTWIPGNARIDDDERSRRIRDFYEPYHAAIDSVLDRRDQPFLLSIHSFTPILHGRERRFDVGILFDTSVAEAEDVAATLTSEGLRVRFNEPYSALDGLIFSARTHGLRFGLRYVEIEINNLLLREAAHIGRIAAVVAQSMRRTLQC